MYDRNANRRSEFARQERKHKLMFVAFVIGILVLFASCALMGQNAASQCQAQGGVYEHDDGECEFNEDDDD